MHDKYNQRYEICYPQVSMTQVAGYEEEGYKNKRESGNLLTYFGLNENYIN